MRRTSLALIGVVLSLTGAASAGGGEPPALTAAPAPRTVAATTFFVSGRGWGHGVGMSQYGALGLANEGRGYAEVLAHFYPSTVLGPAPVARVRVLLLEGNRAVSVSSPVPFRVRDIVGRTYALAAGEIRLGPKLELPLSGTPTVLVGPLAFLPGVKPLVLGGPSGGTPYRGQLEIASTAQKLNVINAVGLEQYLAGVVPREMPAAWHPEALKAQAVAARSYALAHRVGAGKGFDLYADVRSQVYGGVKAEDVRATAAIDATAGEVLLYEGRIASTLFHSTSGGRTIPAAEAFGKAVPYLIGVDDPHSVLSPVHRWGPVAVGDTLARAALGLGDLGLHGGLLGMRLVKERSGRTRSAVIRTTDGETSVTGTTLRRALELRSTWITSLSSLTLTRADAAAVYGRATVVRGEASGTRGIVLSQLVGGSWKQMLTQPTGGDFSFTTKLLRPASFRLDAGALRGPVLRVPVSPQVRLTREAGGLAGVVQPPLAGAAAEVQRLEGGLWARVGTASVDAAGGFRAALELSPGSYRARVAASGGFAAGLSASLRIAG